MTASRFTGREVLWLMAAMGLLVNSIYMELEGSNWWAAVSVVAMLAIYRAADSYTRRALGGHDLPCVLGLGAAPDEEECRTLLSDLLYQLKFGGWKDREGHVIEQCQAFVEAEQYLIKAVNSGRHEARKP